MPSPDPAPTQGQGGPGVGRNMAANLAGRAWVALINFAFVPIYLQWLGIEAYGLIGFFASLMAMFAVLDLGLGLTVNRELARLSAFADTVGEARTLLRTFEAIYWPIGLLIGAVVILAAPWLAAHWLQLDRLSVETATNAIRLMGVVAVLRWPVALYVGALNGLRAQVRQNMIAASGATLASGGAVLVLWLVSPTIPAFFAWQAVAALILVAAMRASAWRQLAAPAHRPQVMPGRLRATLGFSAGITGITLLSIVLTQLDKVVLSRALPLAEFGYYALATAIAAVLQVVGSAVEAATFPALSRLHAAGDPAGLSALYHRSSQGLAVLVVPIATTVAMFAPELLLAYTGDPVIADRTHVLLSLLITGNAILAVMFMPLSLQLACGWTSLSLSKNIVAVVLFVPALMLMVDRFGAAGAGMVWVGLTLGYFIFEVQIMHGRLLRGEQWRWYGQDVGIPLAVSLAVIGGARLLVPGTIPLIAQLMLIGIAGAAALAGSLMLSPLGGEARRLVRGRLGQAAR